MGHFMFDLCRADDVVLDDSGPVCLEASVQLPRVDVHVQRRDEEAFGLFQDLVNDLASHMLTQTFGQQDRKWQAFVIGLSRLIADLAIATRQRDAAQVYTLHNTHNINTIFFERLRV